MLGEELWGIASSSEQVKSNNLMDDVILMMAYMGFFLASDERQLLSIERFGNMNVIEATYS